MPSPLRPLLWLTRFDFQQAPIDLSADLLQVRQIAQTPIHPKVIRVPEGPFGPAAATFLEVLLQVEILIFDVQAGMHSILDHAGAKLSWSSLGHPPPKDQLHTLQPSQIQIVANDLFEELTPAQRTVEDLCQADLHLPDRQTPVVARLPVLWSQG